MPSIYYSFFWRLRGKFYSKIDSLLWFHPIIYYNVFKSSAYLSLVFEFASGGELYNRMKLAHKMPEEHARFYFSELASALRYLHEERNIVYRYKI